MNDFEKLSSREDLSLEKILITVYPNDFRLIFSEYEFKDSTPLSLFSENFPLRTRVLYGKGEFWGEPFETIDKKIYNEIEFKIIEKTDLKKVPSLEESSGNVFLTKEEKREEDQMDLSEWYYNEYGKEAPTLPFVKAYIPTENMDYIVEILNSSNNVELGVSFYIQAFLPKAMFSIEPEFVCPKYLPTDYGGLKATLADLYVSRIYMKPQEETKNKVEEEPEKQNEPIEDIVLELKENIDERMKGVERNLERISTNISVITTIFVIIAVVLALKIFL